MCIINSSVFVIYFPWYVCSQLQFIKCLKIKVVPCIWLCNAGGSNCYFSFANSPFGIKRIFGHFQLFML